MPTSLDIKEFSVLKELTTRTINKLPWFFLGIAFGGIALIADCKSLLDTANQGVISDFTMILYLPCFVTTLLVVAIACIYNKSFLLIDRNILMLCLKRLLKIHDKVGTSHYSQVYYTYGILLISLCFGFLLHQVNLEKFFLLVVPGFVKITIVLLFMLILDGYVDKLKQVLKS